MCVPAIFVGTSSLNCFILCRLVEEQQAIVEHIDSVLERTNAIIADKKQQIETIEEYKKSLIFEYVTGKKEVA